MEVVNPFILKNKERMIVFLDQLSLITDPYTALTGLDLVQNANNQTDSDTGENVNFKRISIQHYHLVLFNRS